MTSTPPVIGLDPWGDDLNAYFAWLENRINAMDVRINALEAKPEHVYNSFAWTFSNLAPPATGSQVRLDNVDLSLATLIDIRLLDSDSADRTPIFQQVKSGDQIRINDWNNAASIHRFTVTGAATMNATNASIPVTWLSGSGVIPNAKANVAFLVALIL